MNTVATETESHRTLFTRSYLGVCLASFLNTSGHFLVAVTLPLVIVSLGFSEGSVGVFVSLIAGSALVFRLLVGGSLDRFGLGRFLIGGPFCFVAAYLVYLFGPGLVPPLSIAGFEVPIVILLAAILQGAGIAVFSTAASTYVAQIVPPARRGEAVGYFGVVANVATALMPPISLWVATSWGFGPMFALASLVVITAALLSAFLPPSPVRPTPVRGPMFAFDTSVLPPALINITQMFGFGIAFTYVPLLGVQRGIGNPGIFFTAYALTMIVVRAVAGRLSDRWGRTVVALPGLAAATAGLLLLAVASTSEQLILSAIVLGFGQATAGPALMAMAIDLAGSGSQGRAMSTYTGMFEIGISGGAIGGGLLLPMLGYSGIFQIAAVVPLFGIAGLLGYARRRERVMKVEG